MGGQGALTATAGGGGGAPATVEEAPTVTEEATVTTAAGGGATAISVGARAAAGGATAAGGVAGGVIVDTAEAAPRAATEAKTGGVTVITADGTGDTAPAETGATPDTANTSSKPRGSGGGDIVHWWRCGAALYCLQDVVAQISEQKKKEKHHHIMTRTCECSMEVSVDLEEFVLFLFYSCHYFYRSL